MALAAARNEWNYATDGTNPPNTTGYYFKLDQTSSTPDIVIKKGATSSGCSEVDVSGSPKIITLPENTTSFSEAEIRGKIAHEIAHPLGLANDNNCPGIANTSDSTCHRTSNSVTQADVVSVNLHLNNYTTNCHTYLPGTTPTPTPEPGGGGSEYTQSYCSSYYLVTDHYLCYADGHCDYWYSDYDYMGSNCMLVQ